MLLAQNWSTSLNTGTSLKLGTSGNENLDFFTNGTKRMILNTHGTLTIPGLSGIGKSLVYVDANGNVLRLPGGPAAGATCVESAWPWSQGGNYPTDNTIGTCNTSDFILKSNNVQSVFLRPSGFVGVGINNSNPQAALDISDNSFSPSVEHFKIFGDLNGSVESTCEMRFFYKPGSGGFYVNEGTFAGSATTKFRVASTASTFNTNLVVNGTSNITSNASIGGGLAVNGTSNLGTASGALLAAKLNVNMASAGNALDVYDQSSGKINFRVKSDGLVY